MKFIMYVRNGMHRMLVRSNKDMKAWNKKASRLEALRRQRVVNEMQDILARMIAAELKQRDNNHREA